MFWLQPHPEAALFGPALFALSAPETIQGPLHEAAANAASSDSERPRRTSAAARLVLAWRRLRFPVAAPRPRAGDPSTVGKHGAAT